MNVRVQDDAFEVQAEAAIPRGDREIRWGIFEGKRIGDCVGVLVIDG